MAEEFSQHKLEGMIRLIGKVERHRKLKKQNSGIAKKNNRRVGAWELYDPESEVRVKTEEERSLPRSNVGLKTVPSKT